MPAGKNINDLKRIEKLKIFAFLIIRAGTTRSQETYVFSWILVLKPNKIHKEQHGVNCVKKHQVTCCICRLTKTASECNWNSYGLICGYWRLFVAGHHLAETSIHC